MLISLVEAFPNLERLKIQVLNLSFLVQEKFKLKLYPSFVLFGMKGLFNIMVLVGICIRQSDVLKRKR